MDVFEALRKMLDAHPAGCPASPEIIGILKLLITEEEAKTALGLGFHPFHVDVIAKRAGVDSEDAYRHLESMADKGVVFTKVKDGHTRYGLLGTMPGLFEFPFMKEREGEIHNKLSAYWESYVGTLMKGLGSPSMPLSRIIPIEEGIPNDKGILPYEKVYELIDKSRSRGVGPCACRIYKKSCDFPKEACLVFNDTADFLIDRGFIRAIGKEEAKRLLKEFDDAGLVHQMNNSQDKIDFICNCCPCCCGLLRCITEFGNPGAVNDSMYLPLNDPEICTTCGLCADERCPMKAIAIDDEGVRIKLDKCIGCGLCVTGCPEGAMRLVRNEEARTPAAKLNEIGMKILTEKGKVEALKPHLDPTAAPNRIKDD